MLQWLGLPACSASGCTHEVDGDMLTLHVEQQTALRRPEEDVKANSLWHLSAHDHFDAVDFQLYVNGFSFTAQDGVENTVSFSPFMVVRNCRFQLGECAKLKCFKISYLEADPVWYFAVRVAGDAGEREADEERSDWALALSHAIMLITESILPRYSIVCDPTPGRDHTQTRLIAGYLVYHKEASSAAVLFCELRAQTGLAAALVLYENEYCDRALRQIIITEETVCNDIVGINCTTFSVGVEIFAALTGSERKLWLRALSNVKVKIQNREAEPTAEDVAGYRQSIREALYRLEATAETGSANSNSLLTLQSWSAGAKTRDDSATKHVASPAVDGGGNGKDALKVSM